MKQFVNRFTPRYRKTDALFYSFAAATLLDHSTSLLKAVMQRSTHLKLSLAGTAAVALACLPLAVTPASAYKLSQGTAASISVMPSNTQSNASSMQFDAGLQNSRNTTTAALGSRLKALQTFILSIFPGCPVCG